MRAVENISEELFDKIRSRTSGMTLGTDKGEVTIDPRDARFFEFQYKHNELPIGAVTISLANEGKLQVFFPNAMVEDMDSKTSNSWYGFLKELSRFAARNMLNFEVKNLTKERLDKKDYQFLTQRNQDEVMENKIYGNGRKSFLDHGEAKVIIHHNRTVDEEVRGSRSRHIEAIYIENKDGERFKFINNYLPGARAMARHVSNEGHTRDERAGHIVDIMSEMQQLKTFVRSVKEKDYVTDDQREIIEAATDRYYGLKDTLKNLASANGYASYFENWDPVSIEVEENDIEELKTKLTRTVYDENITDALPSVGRAMAQKKAIHMENAETLNAFARSNEKIEVFQNDNVAEVKAYIDMIKKTDMPAEGKKRNLIVNIVEYLANNMTDDAMAVAASRLDMSDDNDYKIGMMLAVKFMKGDVEYKAPKAKKDKFGKEKTEGATFESFEAELETIAEGYEGRVIAACKKEGIDCHFKDGKMHVDKEDMAKAKKIIADADMEVPEMVAEKWLNLKAPIDGGIALDQEAIVQEGTWALPSNEEEAMQIAELMKQPMPLGNGGDNATAKIGGLLGDDELFDDLGDAGDKDPKADARPIIIGWMQEHTDWENATYGEMIQKALDKIKADGNMDMEIPRSFGNKQEDVEEVDEVAKSIAALKAMAGIGSNAKSNHGYNEGEEGYLITPRSIVARQLRKLQDLGK